MAKMHTPAMEKLEKKYARNKNKQKASSLGQEAWKRLKRNRMAVIGMGSWQF